MDKEKGKRRLLRVMLAILAQPYRYTKNELAEMVGDKDAGNISNDFDDLRAAGIHLDYDERYRYDFKLEKPFSKLKEILYFTEEDQELLKNAIDHLYRGDKRADQLKRKLGSLYDYHRLGLDALRKPNLKKIDMLKEAQENEKIVIMYNYYSSNSNEVSDKKVEPFHISPDEDLLHAYDVEKEKLRHYRISRIERIEILETDWKYKGKHRIMASDPFRIVSDKQVMIHLRLKVGAYNELTERFPLSKRYIEPSAEEKNIFDFQCKVNDQFIGLTNFILGSYHQLIEVVGPDKLIEHLEEEVKKFQGILGGR